MSDTADELSLDNIDILRHDIWAERVPHEEFALLRREAPVFRHAGTEDDAPEWFWVLSRYEDVQRVSRDTTLFSSQERGTILRESMNVDRELTRTMLETDPPEHTRLRRLVNRGFTPRVVTRFTEHYHELTRTILDRAIAKGSFDFVTEVAAELPLVAIAELLGVPMDDRHKLFEWGNKMVGSTDPEYVITEEEAIGAATELYAYFNALGEERRNNPQDDIVTKLITETDGDALGPHEFETFCLLFTVAGSETTRNAISHGLIALLDNPDQMERFRADTAGLVDTAVEEMVRWASPVIHFARTATADTEIGGQPIKKGELVAMYYVSANRDEAVFDDPYQFDIGRDPNEHVGFGGGGAHFCLGANLARIEMKIMYEELLARTRSISANGPHERLRSNFINGIKHLPVTVEAA